MAGRRRRRAGEGGDSRMGLQDLLSNALGAVIVLTLIAAAITGTGREFLRSPPQEERTVQDADVVDWRPPEDPPEPTSPDTLLVEIALGLDGPLERPLLTAAAAPAPERNPSRLVSATGRRQAYVLLLPIEDDTVWSVGLEEAGRVARMRLRVQAGSVLLRETDWTQPIPQCPEATTVLSLCGAGGETPARTALSMTCGQPSDCG